MKIAGFTKTSLIDFPDTLSSVVFTKSCNFNCGFCHNGDLVCQRLKLIHQEDVFKHLDKRQGIIDGVVVSGGEPTLQNNLIPFLKAIKNKGLKVKLDTNGYAPNVLKKILDEDLVDYIAMDIKNDPHRYEETVGKALDMAKIKKSIDLIKKSDIDYEFRSTLMKRFHNKDSIKGIGELIDGAKRYTLQQYEYVDKQIVDEDYGFYTLEEMKKFVKQLEDYHIEEINIKGRY